MTRSSTVWVSLGNAAQLLPASSLGCLVQSFSVVLSSLENVLCSQVLHSSGLKLFRMSWYIHGFSLLPPGSGTAG